MNKRHQLNDRADTLLELLITGKCSSINSAAIMALGGESNTNDAQIKTLKRLFDRLGYKNLAATAKEDGLSSVKQAKILIARARAKAALEEAEELYNQLGLLEQENDVSGITALMSDLTTIVDKFNDYNLDTVELLSQGLAHSLSGLLRSSWENGHTARDLYGNEALAPRLTIRIECDPSKPQTAEQPFTRVPGASVNGPEVSILINDATPIDQESLDRNLSKLFGPRINFKSKVCA